MLTIALEGIKFYAYHGFYPEEQVTGNHFIMDVRVCLPEPEHPSSLAESVNYEGLYAIAEKIMQSPQPLLEQVVHDITVAIKQRFPGIRSSMVALRKQSPPFGGDVACSLVSLEKQYVI